MRFIAPLLFSFFLFCSSYEVGQGNVTVSVTNNSGLVVTNLMVFSHRFDNLSNGETTKSRSFGFNKEEHNAIIQFEIDGINFAQYLPPPEKGFQRYIIGRVNLEHKIFGIEIVKE